MTDLTPDRTRASKPAAPAQITTHPEFINHEDIILRSADNVRFNIARRDLERTSGWFRDMFDSVNRTSSDDTSEEIPVFEDAAALEAILTIALGRELSKKAISTVSTCESALSAAIKYQMDGVAQVLKSRLECLLWRSENAWDQFILGSRYRLDEIRDAAQERCIGDKLDYEKISGLDKSDLISFLKQRETRAQDLIGVIQSNTNNPAGSNPFHALSNAKCTTCLVKLSSAAMDCWRIFFCKFLERCTTVAGADQIFADPGIQLTAQQLAAFTCGSGHYPFMNLHARVAAGAEARRKERDNRSGGFWVGFSASRVTSDIRPAPTRFPDPALRAD